MDTISFREFMADLTLKNQAGDFPSNGQFELTPLCNLDCKMCYVHLQDASVKNRMLDGDQWIEIMDGAIRRGMMTALLTGGEAMTHPDFKKIYLYLVNHGVIVRLKTNGILLNKENIDFLVKYPPQIVDVSLYGCNSESYLSVTGRDAFETVRNNIRAAIEAGLCVRIMVTPSSYMKPWTDEIIRLAGSFNAADVMVNSLLVDSREGTDRSKDDYNLSAEDSIDAIAIGREVIAPKFLPKEEEERIYGSIEKRPDVSDKGLYCNGGKTGFAVSWDGTMEPCLNFPPEVISAYPLSDGFDAAWKTVNEGVHSIAVPQKCHSCPINTKCHYCPVQHGRHSIENRCDVSVCDFWQKYYSNEKSTLK